MNSNFKLETERLTLRQLTLEDAPFILELLNTSGWLQYIGDKGVNNIKEAQNYIQNGPLSYYKKGLGLGLHAVVRREDVVCIGLCGLLKRTYLDDLDIGYALLPSFQGKGYMKEACLRTIQFCIENLNQRSLAAITSQDNVASIGLLGNLGFHFVKVLNLNEERINHYQLDL